MDAGGIFCPDYVVELRDNFLSSHSDNGHQIWYLLMFEMWREKWL
jgi:asparagine synthase (glutamine-hydrolysing)